MRTDHIDRFNEGTEQFIRLCEQTVDQIKQELDRAELMLRTARAVGSKEIMPRDAARPEGEEAIPAFLGKPARAA
jgi:hypothetical protein